MSKFVKYAWLFFFSFLFLGYWVFVILAVDLVIQLVLWCLKPTWLGKI